MITQLSLIKIKMIRGDFLPANLSDNLSIMILALICRIFFIFKCRLTLDMNATSDLRPKPRILYVYASYGGDLYTPQVKANS